MAIEMNSDAYSILHTLCEDKQSYSMLLTILIANVYIKQLFPNINYNNITKATPNFSLTKGFTYLLQQNMVKTPPYPTKDTPSSSITIPTNVKKQSKMRT